jgi:hypothetical protein
MGRVPQRDDPDLIQIQGLLYIQRCPQVAEVDGIESAAEDTYHGSRFTRLGRLP